MTMESFTTVALMLVMLFRVVETKMGCIGFKAPSFPQQLLKKAKKKTMPAWSWHYYSPPHIGVNGRGFFLRTGKDRKL